MPVELIGTIAAAVVILAITAGITARKGRLRPLVIGLGLAAIPVGLYLTGVLRLTINGIQSLISWFQRTVFTDAVAWGLGLLLGGIALTIVGLVLPKKPARERAVQAPAPGRDVPPAAGRTQSLPGATAAKPTAAPSKPSPSPAAKPAKGKNEPGEFDEIEELLRKRGIM